MLLGNKALFLNFAQIKDFSTENYLK